MLRKSGGLDLKENAKTTAKRVAKGGETDATKAGRVAHKNYNPGPNYQKEVTLPSGKRADAVDMRNRVVKELKPNNPNAIHQGKRQVEQYRRELQREYGGDWTGVVDTYER